MRQKQNQSLKVESIFNLLNEEKPKTEENMFYNKEWCIKLKETKIDDQNLWLRAADLCTDFCKPFQNLLQNNDLKKRCCFCYIIITLRSNKYLIKFFENMDTIIIGKVTDWLLLKWKISNKNLPDLDKTDSTKET